MNMAVERPCTILESLEESLKEMQSNRKNNVKGKTWRELRVELKGENMNPSYENKNNHLFLDNHAELKVYCPFCGKDLSDNIFTQKGYMGVLNSGATCDECGIDVYTYCVIKNE